MSSTGFPHSQNFARIGGDPNGRMQRRLFIVMPVRVLIALVVCLVVPSAARAGSATLFRVFLLDGSSLVAYGEPSRVDDQVIFSMPVGGSSDDPRLHPVSLAASLVDWPRTDRYAVSARYQQYATRAAADYEQLTDEVAALLNEIAHSTDRSRALELAQQARSMLLEWPRTHQGHRESDLRDIVSLLDAAISRLGGAQVKEFNLALVATTEPVDLEPLADMPTAREQLDQIVRVLRLTMSARDREALLHAALAFLHEQSAVLNAEIIGTTRRSLERQLREETRIDQRYARLTRQLLATAIRGAQNARVGDVEHVLARIPREDERLGWQRPEVVQSLTSAVQAQLDRARHLRLLRDQWAVRQAIFRQYQRAVGAEVVQLVKAQSSLEAIRRLDGPDPGRLASLRTRLSGGAARLQRLSIPDFLRPTHELLVGAWRFAENATNARHDAIASGNLATAWEASSAAAGALMLLSRAQQEIRALVERPKLQ